MLTLDRIDPTLIQLTEPLQKFLPPAVVLDKRVTSPWMEVALQRHLKTRNIHTVLISVTETDLCVLAALLGAIDLGYRTILVSDAVCSVSDQAHDAVISLCYERFSEQLELVRTNEVIEPRR
ncbi:cysteine hydrolase family protein [Ochrobactrum sp. RH2CCR150]|uniref:cysteine hydrolase family protein n=1 Tax=Ochrobactrum sp. RH2CCR150 TaxID=2587044 RepID=UPI001790DC92|nr:nicotinamidase-related amidase [Ochrobactrum sp. RH2CCR150]